LRTWFEGHVPPRLCFEVISPNHPHKDYARIQDRYATMGTEELVVFDPLLVGPCSLGGPVLLQKWRRQGSLFERTDFGDEPVFSEVLESWLLPQQRLLVIADDREGTRPWLSQAHHERAEKERERAEKERERALRQALEREVAELRAKLGS
jgi:Uma2 family endonuclease